MDTAGVNGGCRCGNAASCGGVALTLPWLQRHDFYRK
jgi:hypothetical protein